MFTYLFYLICKTRRNKHTQNINFSCTW